MNTWNYQGTIYCFSFGANTVSWKRVQHSLCPPNGNSPRANRAPMAYTKAQFGPASPGAGASHSNIMHFVKSYSRSCNTQHYSIANWIPNIDINCSLIETIFPRKWLKVNAGKSPKLSGAILHSPVEITSNHCPSNHHLLTGKNEFTSPHKANEMIPCHVANSRQSSVFYLSFRSGLCSTWSWDYTAVLL